MRPGGLQTLGAKEQLMALCRGSGMARAGGTCRARGERSRRSGGRRPRGGAGGQAERSARARPGPAAVRRSAGTGACSACAALGRRLPSLLSPAATAAREREMTEGMQLSVYCRCC